MLTTTKPTVTIDDDGQLVATAALQDTLAVDHQARLLAKVIDGTLFLRRPGDEFDGILDEDRLLYTPEHLARVKRAWREPGFRLSAADLLRLVSRAPDIRWDVARARRWDTDDDVEDRDHGL